MDQDYNEFVASRIDPEVHLSQPIDSFLSPTASS